MRHNRRNKKLGRTSSHRRALFRNQVTSLIEHGRIRTTLAKAKALRPIAEKLVTAGRDDSANGRRLVGRWIADQEVMSKLFEDVSPRFSDRPGGYLRIVKLGPRLGDGAEEAILEFIDYEFEPKAADA